MPISESEGGAKALLLDPLDSDPERRALSRDWLRFHGALCLEPEAALARLERAGFDPSRALPSGRRVDLPSPACVDRWCDVLAAAGVGLLPVTSPAYPPRLRALTDAPMLLFVQGSVGALADPLVAIVGARAATRYGLDIAGDLAAGLARAGVCVVSGMARGIDGAAHVGALEAGGRTVALQACGPDQTYPPEHRALRARIAGCGAVISELPPGHPPRAPFFPLRNRLISGLCRVVIVVEARERSGSLITMRHALDQGRDVMAVPGPITAPTSAGPNRLLRDGARPVLEVGDVLEALGIDAGARVAARSHADHGPDDPVAREILSALASQPASRDDLGERLGRPPEAIAASLTALQLAGRVALDRDGCLHVRTGLVSSAGREEG